MVTMLVFLHVICVILALVAYEVPLICAAKARIDINLIRLHKVAEAFGAFLSRSSFEFEHHCPSFLAHCADFRWTTRSDIGVAVGGALDGIG